MPIDLQLSDLARLDRIREVLAQNDPRGQFAALGINEIALSDDAIDGLAAIVDRQLAAAGMAGQRARIRLIVDPVTIRRSGQDLKAEVARVLALRHDVVSVVLDDGHPVLHADEPILDRAARAAIGADCIVSVGGGTITDIAKIAAERAGVAVHVVVQTAASVDGFTDNFAVVLQNGVKKTLPSRWPEAVLTDTRTVAEAPHTLNAAGFGELLSMFSAPGDWLLAHRLGMDDSFAPVLIDMLALCGEGVGDWSAGVGRGDPAACARLAAALAMRGIVTGVGGTTASLSGMEHLFSHMLDMVSAERGEPTGLHGAQVGVGSVIRAAVWEEFCHRIDTEGLPLDQLFADVGAWEQRVTHAFSTLDPSGRLGGECWSRFRLKLAAWQNAREKVAAALADWPALRADHDRITLGSHEIALYLHRAGSPRQAHDLDPAPPADLVHWVVANCQFMRERFTVADLMLLAGWWDAAGVARVLARVEAACAAATATGR